MALGIGRLLAEARRGLTQLEQALRSATNVQAPISEVFQPNKLTAQRLLVANAVHSNA
jgi:hypothetical protein